MQSEIKFNTQPMSGIAGDKGGVCRCALVHNESIPASQAARDMAKMLRIDEIEAQLHLSLVARYITESLAEGKRVDLGPFAIGLSLTGTVRGANGAATPKKNRVVPYLKPGKTLNEALAGLKPVNAGSSGGPRILRIVGETDKTEGRIRLGEKIIATGANFLVNRDAPDEGVWLETRSGQRLLRATILESTAPVLKCRFDGALEDGEYCFAVYTRTGDATRPTPAACRRKISLSSREP